MSENEERRRDHEPRQAPESSTFLRFMSILASKAEGDFEFDESRSMIKLSHIWVAEAKNQEELNSRFVTSTYFIMASLAWKIELLKDSGEHADWVKEYREIETAFNTCDVVTVSTEQAGMKDHREFRVMVSTTNKDSESQRTSLKPVPNSEMMCNVEDLAVALEAQKENGYRRINCTAKGLYFRALKLAHVVGYIDSSKGVDMKVDKPRSEQMMSEEDMLRSKRTVN